MDLKPKGLLKRVFDFALAEIDRRSRPPERLSSAPSAEVLPSQADTPARAPRPAPPAPADADVPLELSRVPSGALMVRWALSELDVSAARTLAPDDAHLAVRLVAFTPDSAVHVRREVLDLPAETLSGYMTLQRPDEERLVVAVGLLSGEQFVSVVHAELA